MKKTLLYIAFGVVCGLLAAGIVFLASRSPRGSAVLLSPPPTPRLWVVQVSGAVAHPGVYELPAGSRVRDAVEAAGGLTSEAIASAINLAGLLEDGKNIAIPAYTPTPAESGSHLSATPQLPVQGDQTVAATAATGELININSASADELDQLPGIGPVIAQRIIDYRSANGLFTSIDDIVEVPGIGPVTFDKIKSLITVEP